MAAKTLLSKTTKHKSAEITAYFWLSTFASEDASWYLIPLICATFRSWKNFMILVRKHTDVLHACTCACIHARTHAHALPLSKSKRSRSQMNLITLLKKIEGQPSCFSPPPSLTLTLLPGSPYRSWQVCEHSSGDAPCGWYVPQSSRQGSVELSLSCI